MDAFFTGLTKRQAMLLLTAVTFGGQEGVQAFDFLPDEEADVLRHRAGQILAIPRDKRVPFLVQEIKRFVTGRKAYDLRAADPKRVAEVLGGERDAMVEVILRAMPASVADDVRIELAQPVMELRREIRPDILSVIRWKVEQRLATAMPKPSGFAIVDLLVLSSGELICLADVLGAKWLSPLVAPLPDEAREAFLKQLPPDQRLQLARAIQDRPPARRTEAEAAREAVKRLVEGIEPHQALRMAGLRRIARACLAQSPELAARLIEKQRGELGRQIARCVSEERKAPRRSDEAVKREVLDELELLADRGLVERPVRLPPPPIPKRPPPRPIRDLSPPEPRPPPRAPSAAAPPAPGAQRAPSPAGARPRVSSPSNPGGAPRIQRGGAAAEPPPRRPSVVVRPSPLRGPRKP
ncbi:MAG: hypothetical protein ACOX6T_19655 [Myxococcales bacterium]|jgi:hypothetical protein